jgi:sulfur-carrier protein
MIRLELPAHLRALAQVNGEVKVDAGSDVTIRSVLDALEACYPMLRGTIRDHVSQQRRPFLRFFACMADLSKEPPDAPLPTQLPRGQSPFSRSIIERHHGRLWAEPNDGAPGATFSFSIPLDEGRGPNTVPVDPNVQWNLPRPLVDPMETA